MKTLNLLMMALSLLTSSHLMAHEHGKKHNHHSKWCHYKHHHSKWCHHQHHHNECRTKNQIIYPIKTSAQNLYFDVNALKLLQSPSFQLSSAYLNVQVQGKRRLINVSSKLKSKYEYLDRDDLRISINGIKAHGLYGKRFCEFKDYNIRKNQSDYRFNLHDMALNGSEKMAEALQRIINNEGMVQVSFQGNKKVVLANAYLEIRGKDGSCSVPPVVTPSVPTTLAPVTVIQSVDPQGLTVASTSMTLNFAADQNGVSFKCSLDGAAQVACTSPLVYSNLANGPHTFKVFSTNSQGQSDVVGATYSWAVDSVAPSVAITNLNTLKTLTNIPSISVNFISATAVSFQCSIDDGSYSVCSSPVNYAALTEGTHKVSIKGMNSAGKLSTVPAVFQWSIDMTPPFTNFDSITPIESVSAQILKNFSFSANETSTYECNIDGQGYNACISPFALNNLQDGNHSITVRAKDLAGNVGVEASYNWTVDTIAPLVSIVNTFPIIGLNNSSNLMVEFISNENVQYSCTFDGVTQDNCASPFSLANILEGNHEFKVWGTDLAGNTSVQASAKWTMDFTLPLIAWGQMLPSSASFINSTTFQASVTSSEQVYIDAYLNGLNLNQNSSSIFIDQLSEGAYLLEVRSKDSANNIGNILSHNFFVDLTAPNLVVTSLLGNGMTNLTTNTISLTSNEEVTYQCSLNNAGFSSCDSIINLSGLAEGNQVFQVQSIDLAGNLSDIKTISWVIDSSAPISSLNNTRNSNDSISFSFGANELVKKYECSIDGSAFQECVSPVLYSNLSVGNHTFKVRSIDLAGNIEIAPVSFSWVVDLPVSTNMNNVTTNTQGNNLTFNFSSNLQGTTFRCGLDGATPSTCSSPFSLTGLADGDHVFNVFAVDKWGTVDSVGASYSWTTDTTAPIAQNISFTVTNNSMTVNWTTSEASTSKVNWGLNVLTNNSSVEDLNLVTNHSVTVTGLSAFTVYSYVVAGKDKAGNTYVSARAQLRTAR